MQHDSGVRRWQMGKVSTKEWRCGRRKKVPNAITLRSDVHFDSMNSRFNGFRRELHIGDGDMAI